MILYLLVSRMYISKTAGNTIVSCLHRSLKMPTCSFATSRLFQHLNIFQRAQQQTSDICVIITFNKNNTSYGSEIFMYAFGTFVGSFLGPFFFCWPQNTQWSSQRWELRRRWYDKRPKKGPPCVMIINDVSF